MRIGASAISIVHRTEKAFATTGKIATKLKLKLVVQYSPTHVGVLSYEQLDPVLLLPSQVCEGPALRL